MAGTGDTSRTTSPTDLLRRAANRRWPNRVPAGAADSLSLWLSAEPERRRIDLHALTATAILTLADRLDALEIRLGHRLPEALTAPPTSENTCASTCENGEPLKSLAPPGECVFSDHRRKVDAGRVGRFRERGKSDGT